jgi:cyclophilin family peptidyl-prolyl cis-trans isomerase
MIGNVLAPWIGLALVVGAGGADPSPAAKPVHVRIQTEAGDIEVALDAAKAPRTVANFLKYVDGNFYDGGRFHRTVTPTNQPANQVKIEVIQAGINPDRLKDEFKPIPLERTRETGLKHTNGTISMARDGPDTATSDFFICIGDQPELDFGGRRNPDGQGFAAFGQVVRGMAVVKRIQQAPADKQTLQPPVKILRITRLPTPDNPPASLAPFFTPPAQWAGQLGAYRSPLLFDDGTPVRTPADWQKRRAQIRTYWHKQLGEWPALLEKPRLEYRAKERRGTVTQHQIAIETAPGRTVEDAYLLVPDGPGPFPAVVVVFYEARTGIGLGKANHCDFALQLAQRGFVTLSLGGDPNTYYPTRETCRIQPLSFHAYETANCCTALAGLPYVDPGRIGIVGHSYGGKWALFAAAFHDSFACAAWSDPGSVFDETRGNVNYWEPWYLGFEPGQVPRKPGIPNQQNPRTGPYKQLIADGRDLHELHALIAPRPFFVSGGSEDPPERWTALNHTVAVNKLLGFDQRVGMTNRKGHAPTEESNAQLYQFFEWVLRPTPPKK